MNESIYNKVEFFNSFYTKEMVDDFTQISENLSLQIEPIKRLASVMEEAMKPLISFSEVYQASLTAIADQLPSITIPLETISNSLKELSFYSDYNPVNKFENKFSIEAKNIIQESSDFQKQQDYTYADEYFSSPKKIEITVSELNNPESSLSLNSEFKSFIIQSCLNIILQVTYHVICGIFNVDIGQEIITHIVKFIKSL